MKILITGFSGFVSHHFLEFLEANAVDAQLLGVARTSPNFVFDSYRRVRCSFRQLDLLDRGAVKDLVKDFHPTHILHLAAYSSVGFSWERPVDSFTNNTNILLNVLDQVRELGIDCRILSVGSSEEYGNVSHDILPLREDAPLSPISPYAVARVAQELLSKVFVVGYGLQIVMTRSFNHIGAYQRDAFVVPSLAKQLVAIRHGSASPRLITGDRSIVRDFVDVRDVVRAYFALLLRGTVGEIYNVCSGRGTRIDEIIALMQEILGTDAALETDPRLVRPSENHAIVGSNEKIEREIGWAPTISLQESIATILDWVTTQSRQQ